MPKRRRKCWIGAAIGAATQIGGSIFGGIQQNKIRKRQEMLDRLNESYKVSNFNDSLNNTSVEDEYRDKVVFRYGGTRNKANYGCFAGRRVRR